MLGDRALREQTRGPDALAILQCSRSSNAPGSHLALPLLETTAPGIYRRSQNAPVSVTQEEALRAEVRVIYIQGPQPASQYPLYWCEIDVIGPHHITLSPIYNHSFTRWSPNRLRAEATALLLNQTKVSMAFSCCISAAAVYFLLVLELDLVTNKQFIRLHAKPEEQSLEN